MGVSRDIFFSLGELAACHCGRGGGAVIFLRACPGTRDHCVGDI